MSEISSQLNVDLKNAMREKDALKLDVLRMLLSAIKNKRIELKVEELDNDQVLQVLASEIKKRKDSIESYVSGEREDLAEQERKEIAILEVYQPEQMSEEEVVEVVKSVVAEMGEVDKSQFGQIMGACMGKLKGKADGLVVKKAVEEVLRG